MRRLSPSTNGFISGVSGKCVTFSGSERLPFAKEKNCLLFSFYFTGVCEVL